ncbi:MAG: hypothetical protein IK025_00080 [Bacteroidales bacterium]|nr:hypothetical protein [Bacteroidales bacterium]
MNENKTYFQNVSVELEDLLKKYKNEYPRNMGAMFRTFFPTFLIILAIFFFLYCIVNTTYTTVIIGGLISPILFFFSRRLKKRNLKENVTDENLSVKIKEAKSKIENYTEYPDVKKYLEQYEIQLEVTRNAKARTRKNFKILCIALIAVALTAFIYSLMNDSQFVKGNLRNDMTCDYTRILNVDEMSPFLSLKPLETNNPNVVKAKTSTANIFISGVSSRTSLLLSEMEIEGASKDDIIRITITDTEGTPISRCPKFVFTADKTKEILSETFCQNPKYKTSKEFETMKVLKYMNDNKANLRFVIEKL